MLDLDWLGRRLANLGREDEDLSVSACEVDERRCERRRVVLVQKVPDVGHDLELELALHLADDEVVVEALLACEDEYARAARGEEAPREALVPAEPEGLGRDEVGAPDLRPVPVRIARVAQHDVRGHADARARRVADAAAVEVPLDRGRHGRERRRPLREDALHERERLDGRPLHNVERGDARHRVPLRLQQGGRVDARRGAHRVPDELRSAVPTTPHNAALLMSPDLRCSARTLTIRLGAAFGSGNVCRMTPARSAISVGRLRSVSLLLSALSVRVLPCPRASNASTPYSGPRAAISFASAAKLSPLAPAPWCSTKNVPCGLRLCPGAVTEPMPGAEPEVPIADGTLPGNVAGADEGSAAATDAPGLTADVAQGACVGFKPPPGGPGAGFARDDVDAAGRPGELGTAFGGVRYARNVVSLPGGLISRACAKNSDAESGSIVAFFVLPLAWCHERLRS